jgi:hypothetical protein
MQEGETLRERWLEVLAAAGCFDSEVVNVIAFYRQVPLRVGVDGTLAIVECLEVGNKA